MLNLRSCRCGHDWSDHDLGCKKCLCSNMPSDADDDLLTTEDHPAFAPYETLDTDGRWTSQGNWTAVLRHAWPGQVVYANGKRLGHFDWMERFMAVAA